MSPTLAVCCPFVLKPASRIPIGVLIIGEIPSWRVDHMPYGVVKDSGLGREGIRWAMHDMMEERLLIIREKQG